MYDCKLIMSFAVKHRVTWLQVDCTQSKQATNGYKWLHKRQCAKACTTPFHLKAWLMAHWMLQAAAVSACTQSKMRLPNCSVAFEVHKSYTKACSSACEAIPGSAHMFPNSTTTHD